MLPGICGLVQDDVLQHGSKTNKLLEGRQYNSLQKTTRQLHGKQGLGVHIHKPSMVMLRIGRRQTPGWHVIPV